MKRWRTAIFLLPIILLSLTACTNSGHQTAEDTNTLTLIGKSSDLQKSYMTSIFNQYETETGKKLEIISIPDTNYAVELEKRAKTDDLPDVILHFNNSLLNELGIEDHFCYLNDEAWIDDLTESSNAYCQDSKGNILGLPFWENSISGCYYNKTILDSLGLRAASTQAEFDALCQALTDIGYTPLCWPAKDCSWMYQFGLDPVFADEPERLEQLNAGDISYADIPEVTNMVEWIQKAEEKGWLGKDYLEIGWDNLSSELGSGSSVMVFIWDTWFDTDLMTEQKYSKDDFALMPVFVGTTENGTYEGGNLNMMMVNKNSENLDEALNFLSFCADEKHYNIAFDGISTVNCFKGQTTNIQSNMVTAAMPSIMANQRTSTAEPKIVGYDANDFIAIFQSLFKEEIDVKDCIELMDKHRTDTQE